MSFFSLSVDRVSHQRRTLVGRAYVTSSDHPVSHKGTEKGLLAVVLYVLSMCLRPERLDAVESPFVT